MRTNIFKIGKKEYLLTINNRVLKTLEDRKIKLAEIIDEDAPITRIAEIFCMMSDAGARYAKKMGLGEYDTIKEEDLLDMTGPEEFESMVEVFTDLAIGDRKVDAELPAGKDQAVQTAQKN